MNLISTLSHWNANSYVSRNYANQYLSAHPDYDVWENLASDRRDGCLIQATAILDASPLFGVDSKLFTTKPYNQSLRYPLRYHDTVSGTIGAAFMNRITCADLSDPTLYRDDYFVGGAVRITNADGSITIAEITTFYVSSGTLIFSESLAAAPDSGLDFEIVYPFDVKFLNGVCEFALEIARGGFDGTGANIPLKIRSMLSNYFAQSGRVYDGEY